MRGWLAGLVLLGAGAQAAPEPEQAAEIEYLIGYVARAEVVFLRNGRAYTGPQAAAHIRKKYDHFIERIGRAEDFIEWAASKSLISGRAYRVRIPDAGEMNSADWLRGVLQRYRQSQGVATP